MFRRNPFFGSGLAVIAAAMTSAFNAMRPGNASLPPPKVSKNEMKRHHRRISAADPNTIHGALHNGTAFVYNQTRERARRLRQAGRETQVLKMLHRERDLIGSA